MADMVARVLLKQTTEMTARCAGMIHGSYCAGETIADLAEHYGLDSSTIEWWINIGRMKRPHDAPKTFAAPAPTVLKGFEQVYG
jgi:hypothetical protein